MTLKSRPNDAFILKEVIDQECYKRLNIQPGDTVLDAGAHIGAFVCYALNQGAGHVISFEPHPENFEFLQANYGDANSEVSLFQAAVTGSQIEEIDLYTAKAAHSATTIAPPRGGKNVITVKAVSFRKLMEVHRPDRVKLDIKGAEYPILSDLNKVDMSSVKVMIVAMRFDRPERLIRGKELFEQLGKDWDIHGNIPEKTTGWDKIITFTKK